MSDKKATKNTQKRAARGGCSASPCSDVSDTPRTDEAVNLYKKGACTNGWIIMTSEGIERDLNDAWELCRWAFPRLRAMCHDFDNTDTGWECFEKMDSHPEIFSENNH